jgi:hypothetical protein
MRWNNLSGGLAGRLAPRLYRKEQGTEGRLVGPFYITTETIQASNATAPDSSALRPRILNWGIESRGALKRFVGDRR